MAFKKNNILSLMFDVRPVDEKGDLNLEKIGFKNVKKIIPEVSTIKPEFEIARDEIFQEEIKKEPRSTIYFEENPIFKNSIPRYFVPVRSIYSKKSSKNIFGEFKNIFSRLSFGKLVLMPAGVFLAIILTIGGTGFLQKALLTKNLATRNGQKAFTNLVEAKGNLESRDFNTASLNFQQAYEEFSLISKEIDSLGGNLLEVTRFIPYLSKISSGANLTKAGEDISQAGVIFSGLAKDLSRQSNTINQPEISFLEILKNLQTKSQEISILLERASGNIDKVAVTDLPENYQEKFLELKDKLPEALSLIQSLRDNEEIFTEVLGGNGPRKYLFLFQNNQEMRATGGFIGSYGVLNIFNGRIKNFFVDGIFNPDGQLKEKVIPPMPIQKISAAWSLHDSNWFPDFPVSAEKAIWFYEKTGGPTVDGVITMTPSVMQKLLEITGPIEMPDYQVTIDKDNFLEKVQMEVEVDYDKELNQPKKILADLAPLILDRLFNGQNFSQMGKIFKAMEESIKERQILIYARNYEVEKKISAMGCSGEILKTDKDYLSIINSNINGYKTDGVIEQKIEHEVEIRVDGSIQNTVTITRKHLGGNSAYEWWNKVNADYMRIYVPRGSSLVSVEGQTREFNTPPLDYRLLGFKQDPQVRQEEDSMEIDQESGTRIYSDAGKTVFANWVYVSPQEEVKIKYVYMLPFKIKPEENINSNQSYSLLFQKQSGSLEESFSSKIIYPDNFYPSWKYPEDLERKEAENVLIKLAENIKTDKFIGAAFIRK
jgi:hypothetical protein